MTAKRKVVVRRSSTPTTITTTTSGSSSTKKRALKIKKTSSTSKSKSSPMPMSMSPVKDHKDKIPRRPRVDRGPKSVGIASDGKSRWVYRFWVHQSNGYQFFGPNKGKQIISEAPWFVVDYKKGGIAEGSNPKGYSTQEEAVKAARKYRNKLGPYTKSPF